MTDPARSDIEKTVVDFLMRIQKLPDGFAADTSLYADGAELDSLETAELSAVLEDTWGDDPFTSSEMPQNLDDIVEYFASRAG